MKNQKYKHQHTGRTITAYQRGLSITYDFWKEQKDAGEIPEDSGDFDHFIKPEREELIRIGVESIEAQIENEEELGWMTWRKI
jgi:hypothetical protein